MTAEEKVAFLSTQDRAIAVAEGYAAAEEGLSGTQASDALFVLANEAEKLGQQIRLQGG